MLRITSYSAFSLDERLSMQNWHSLQFLQALLGNSVSLVSEGTKSGSVKNALRHPNTLAVPCLDLGSTFRPSFSVIPMFPHTTYSMLNMDLYRSRSCHSHVLWGRHQCNPSRSPATAGNAFFALEILRLPHFLLWYQPHKAWIPQLAHRFSTVMLCTASWTSSRYLIWRQTFYSYLYC